MAKAALRDASWTSSPNTTTPKRYHVVKDDGTPRCGLMLALCTEDAIDLHQVPASSRCGRRGCKEKWPDA